MRAFKKYKPSKLQKEIRRATNVKINKLFGFETF